MKLDMSIAFIFQDIVIWLFTNLYHRNIYQRYPCTQQIVYKTLKRPSWSRNIVRKK